MNTKKNRQFIFIDSICVFILVSFRLFFSFFLNCVQFLKVKLQYHTTTSTNSESEWTYWRQSQRISYIQFTIHSIDSLSSSLGLVYLASVYPFYFIVNRIFVESCVCLVHLFEMHRVAHYVGMCHQIIDWVNGNVRNWNYNLKPVNLVGKSIHMYETKG